MNLDPYGLGFEFKLDLNGEGYQRKSSERGGMNEPLLD
jgi:hypothetical protein